MPPRKKKPVPVPAPFEVDAGDLTRGLHNALLCTGPDPYLPVLQSVLVESDGKGIAFVATDRYTIACTTLPIATPPFKFLMRGDDARLLLKLFTAKAARLTVAVENESLTVQPSPGVLDGPQVVVTCHAQDGEFPKYRGILDGSYGAKPKTAYEPGTPVGFNGQYMARFARVKSGAGRTDPASALRLRVVHIDGPTFIDIGDEFCGAIMPVRLDSQQYAKVAPKAAVA